MTNYAEERQDAITLAQAFNLVHAEWLERNMLVDEKNQDKFQGRVNYIYALITQTRNKMFRTAEQQKGLNI